MRGTGGPCADMRRTSTARGAHRSLPSVTSHGPSGPVAGQAGSGPEPPPAVGRGLVARQSAPCEGLEPSAHRPPAPPAAEARGVVEDVVHMLERRRFAAVVLVVGPGPADPAEADSGPAGDLAEVGVL